MNVWTDQISFPQSSVPAEHLPSPAIFQNVSIRTLGNQNAYQKDLFFPTWANKRMIQEVEKCSVVKILASLTNFTTILLSSK